MTEGKVKRFLVKEKLEPYMKILLTGLPTAIAILFGQGVLTWNYTLFGGLIVSLLIFIIVSFFYLTEKRSTGKCFRMG